LAEPAAQGQRGRYLGAVTRIALVDPSLFTLPYDAALIGGLEECGADVTLWGRPLRPGEAVPPVDLRAAFFRREEAFSGRKRTVAKALGSLGAWRWALPEIEAWAPDVVHLQWLTAPLLDRRRIEALKRFSTVAITVHDAVPFQGAASALQSAGWFKTLAAADLLLVHHACTAEALRQAGVDRPTVRVQHGPLRARRVGLFEPGLLVQFGTIKPYKGHDVLLRALVQLPDHRLLIAGPGDASALHRLAETLGVEDRVEFDTRFVPDDELDDLLSRADVFVLPYRRADASGVLWRIAGLGRPVIASRVGGLAEDLRDGDTAALVPPEDPAALATAIRNRDASMGDRLVDEAESRSWSATAQDHLDAYQQFSSRRPSARNPSR
jgi:glycosyltransferase involved in cell wall biosynthesis